MTRYFRFASLLQRSGWITPAFVGIDELGNITKLSQQSPQDVSVEAVDGFALPGFQNAHSHAFQYAMAGIAENHPGVIDDDFWSWREAMYQCALAIGPEEAQAVAAMVYGEMVRQGYTHVAEFHYLHHDKNGSPYTNLAEMGERLVAAAKSAGIKVTLVPVFYQKGGFGKDPLPRQRRFISKTIEDYLRLFEATEVITNKYAHASIGVSVHSLRAVDLNDVVTIVNHGPQDLPFHIHVAEQKGEVSDCYTFCSKRPMEWLLDNVQVNSRFNLVHSTHLDDLELNRVATSNATVVLCPSTEGNLADGIFRMKKFAKLGGNWTIGTDSHIGINPLEELRMIDYRQRLITNKRNTFEGEAAQYMINSAVKNGRTAMGIKSNDHFEIGRPLDAVVYSASSHLFENTSEKNRLSTILFTSDTSKTTGTIVSGKWVVRNQHHVNGALLKRDFSNAMMSLKIR